MGASDDMTVGQLQAALRREVGKLSRGIGGRDLSEAERAAHEAAAWELFRELDRRRAAYGERDLRV